jgi:plasmid stabilization system protein ParE
MKKPVLVSAKAEEQIATIDAWWHENRDKAPELFQQELAQAFETISVAPELGRRHPWRGVEVRRVLMRSTRHHVYYVDQPDSIVVVAVWGAVRGAGPDLTGLR